MKQSRGFTLIELLVVIAIIGILSSVVLTSLNTARTKGNDSAVYQNLTQVRTALESYANDNGGKYPASSTNWNSQCDAWTKTTADNAIPGLVSGGYIAHLPTHPQQSTAGNTCCYLYLSSNGEQDYKYMLYNCATSNACYSNANKPFKDPARTFSCAVYTTGAATW